MHRFPGIIILISQEAFAIIACAFEFGPVLPSSENFGCILKKAPRDANADNMCISSYEENLLNITTTYSSHPDRPLSELEVFAGTILGKTGTQTIRQRRLCISMRECFKEDLAFTVKCMTRGRGQAQEQGPSEDVTPNTTKVGSLISEATGEGLELCMAWCFVGLRVSGGATDYKLRSFALVAAAMCFEIFDAVERLRTERGDNVIPF